MLNRFCEERTLVSRIAATSPTCKKSFLDNNKKKMCLSDQCLVFGVAKITYQPVQTHVLAVAIVTITGSVDSTAPLEYIHPV